MFDKQNSKMPVDINKSYKDFLIVKMVKLSSANYLVTGLMSDREPLKWRIRKISLICVSASEFFYSDNLSTVERGLDQLRKGLSEIMNILNLAMIAGIISEMNHSILIGEFEELRKFVEEKLYLPLSAGFKLNRDSFAAPMNGSGSDDFEGFSRRKAEDIKKLDVKTLEEAERVKPPLTPAVLSSGKFPSEGVFTEEENAPSYVSQKRVGSGLTLSDLNERKSAIKRLLDEGGEYTVGQICGLLKGKYDCSEKTVQRDLVALVSDGLILKKGERRWSRYFKNSSIPFERGLKKVFN